MHRHTVLIIDDDQDTLEVFSVTLTLADVVAHAVSSGEEALALLERGLRPCAVLLDVRMPRLNGWQVWEAMRESASHLESIPVIFVSAEPPDPPRATRAAIAAWLQKPVGVRQLHEAIARVCGGPT